MVEDNVKTRMRALLDELDYNFADFTLDDFVSWLERQRGRPIILQPWSMPPAMSGTWIADDRYDHIFFDKHASPVLQDHIKLHEIAHILCGHDTVKLEPEKFSALLNHPAVPLAAHEVLMRSTHTGEQEIEAETLAALIQERVIKTQGSEKFIALVSSDEEFEENLKAMELD